MAEPLDPTAQLSEAIAQLADELRELRAVTAEENLELRGRIRRLEATMEQRDIHDATDEPDS